MSLLTELFCPQKLAVTIVAIDWFTIWVRSPSSINGFSPGSSLLEQNALSFSFFSFRHAVLISAAGKVLSRYLLRLSEFHPFLTKTRVLGNLEVSTETLHSSA